MGKIEKTLELNITHEILSLADSFWWYLQPISLKNYWRPNWRFPLIQQPKSFVTGLHINLEGKKGGGYDVCIKSPSSFTGGNPRMLFMQFKAGINSNGVLDSKSIFSTAKNNPNKHIEFSINNNRAKIKQHQLLHDLAKSLGNNDAAVYVFPQIIDETTLSQNIGSLLQKTLFLSISDIESKATENGVSLLDGNPHKFRLCYKDIYKSEVNLLLFPFGRPKSSGGVIGEIFSIRVYRALSALQMTLLPNFPISGRYITDALIKHVLNIASNFSLSPRVLENIVVENEALDIERIYDALSNYKQYFSNNIASEYNIEVAKDILLNIGKYLSWADSLTEFTSESIIPQPPANYTIEVPDNGLQASFEGSQFATKLFADLTYQLY